MRNLDIKQLIEGLESRLVDFKNQYPKNMAECWRRYAPYLALAVAVFLLPIFYKVQSLGFRALLLFGCPVAIIMSINAIRRRGDIYKNLPDLKKPVEQGISQFADYQQYSDIRNYCQRTSAELATVESYKSRCETVTKVLCGIVLLAVLSFSVFMFTSRQSSLVSNPVFGYLGLQNHSTFQVQAANGAHNNLAHQPCTFRIEDENDTTGQVPAFYLRALDISISADGNSLYMLRFVDDNNVSVADMPYFVFNGSQISQDGGVLSQGINSASSNTSKYRITNLRVLQKIKDGKLKYVVEKI